MRCTAESMPGAPSRGGEFVGLVARRPGVFLWVTDAVLSHVRGGHKELQTELQNMGGRGLCFVSLDCESQTSSSV